MKLSAVSHIVIIKAAGICTLLCLCFFKVWNSYLLRVGISGQISYLCYCNTILQLLIFIVTYHICYQLVTTGKNVKESRNRPSVAQRVPGGLGSQIS